MNRDDPFEYDPAGVLADWADHLAGLYAEEELAKLDTDPDVWVEHDEIWLTEAEIEEGNRLGSEATIE